MPVWRFMSNRGLTEIGLEEFKVLLRKQTDSFRQLVVIDPGLRGSVLFQSGVQRPASKCSFERMTLESNRPARTSLSIF